MTLQFCVARGMWDLNFMTCRSELGWTTEACYFLYVTVRGDIADQSCHGVFAEE